MSPSQPAVRRARGVALVVALAAGACDSGAAEYDGGLGGDAAVDADAAADAATADAGVCSAEDRPQPNVGLAEAPGVGGCPAGMIPVGSFCIDRYEGALVAVADGTPWSPFHNPGATAVRAVSLAGAVPQGYITGDQAAAACAAAGKRLCTDVEWLRACRGPGGLIYPYGDTRDPGACNDARAMHPAIELFGTSADWIWSMLGHPCINQLPDSLAATGSHAACVTAEGAFDMMGNLHEWTADSDGTFRGGFYVDTVINGDGCLYVTTAHSTAHWDYSTGFRCCANAP
ncbi:MAG TPA: SUMF1/EgtB/PvdO family nonheme iron enzyme [Kofleriaceae bacterium]|nr:SUMF1/EgtB/PvdO family nonheme iron enzyme [Kofleriaceae bacterium]